MTKQHPLALYVYVPPEQPYGDNWVEQVLGEVVRPVYERFKTKIDWLWITRYSGPYDRNQAPWHGANLPERYRSKGHYRYVLFRMNTFSQGDDEVHKQAIELSQQAGCYIEQGWTDYDMKRDLGSNRFNRVDAGDEGRAGRAEMIARLIDATVKVMLDMLVVDDTGRWTLEPSIHEQNPNGSVFESIHHLFCNTTNVPTTALLSLHNHQLQVKTFWQGGQSSISIDPVKGFLLSGHDTPAHSLEVLLKY